MLCEKGSDEEYRTCLATGQPIEETLKDSFCVECARADDLVDVAQRKIEEVLIAVTNAVGSAIDRLRGSSEKEKEKTD